MSCAQLDILSPKSRPTSTIASGVGLAKDGHDYAQSKDAYGKVVKMHRLAMDAPDGILVDHINHDACRLANFHSAISTLIRSQNGHIVLAATLAEYHMGRAIHALYGPQIVSASLDPRNQVVRFESQAN